MFEIVLFLILSPITSIYILWKFSTELIMGFKSLTWIKTKANIEDIGIKEVYSRGFSFFCVEIEYSYILENHNFKGNRYSYKYLMYLKRKAVEKIINDIDPKDFNIHYNPQKYGQSIVIPGPSYFANIAMLLLGIFIFFIPVVYCFDKFIIK